MAIFGLAPGVLKQFAAGSRTSQQASRQVLIHA